MALTICGAYYAIRIACWNELLLLGFASFCPVLSDDI